MLVLVGTPSGLVRDGTVPSAFRTIKLDKPPKIGLPFASVPVTSFTLIVMLAVGLLDKAKTVRDAPECAPIATFTLATGAGSGLGRVGWLGSACWNEAKPLGSAVPFASSG